MWPFKDKKIAFFIPCLFRREGNFIFECVEGIHNNYPDSDIIIVDSNSENTDYINELQAQYGYKIKSIMNNSAYEWGAYIKAHAQFKHKYDIIFCIQDSLIIKSQIPLNGLDNKTVLVFENISNDFGTDSGCQNFCDFAALEGYSGMGGPLMCVWNSFIVTNDAINKMIDSKFFQSVKGPDTKAGSRFWERAWGICFGAVDIKTKIFDDFVAHQQYTKKFGGRG